MIVAAGSPGAEMSVLGSLSGGCIEGVVASAALEVLEEGGTRHETFSYSPDEAFAIGLTCGGEIEVRIQELPSQLLQNLVGPTHPVAIITRLTSDRSLNPDTSDSVAVLYRRDELLSSLQSVLAHNSNLIVAAIPLVEEVLDRGEAGIVIVPDTPREESAGTQELRILVESRLPAPRFLIVGANDFSSALIPVAKLLGYYVTMIDARPVFAEQERFSKADEVVVRWPHSYLLDEAAAGRIDPRTVVCVLTHDPKFDIPTLDAALRLNLAYLGAMGSRRSHRVRATSLAELGHRQDSMRRLHSPIGLDLGAVTPSQIAISIAAEIISCDRPAAAIASLSLGNGPPRLQPK